jgi:hypothetical protein
MWRGLFTVNLFLLTLRSTLTFTVNVLRRMRENVRQKRPELWRNHNWLLHHDNASAHTSLKTTEFVTNNMVIVPHPPYSPDSAPSGFALLPKVKMKLKGRCFETIVWHPKGIASSSRQQKGKLLPQCFWSMEKTMGLLYTFPRRLFWRRRQPNLSKLSQHFFFDLVQDLSDRMMEPYLHSVCSWCDA